LVLSVTHRPSRAFRVIDEPIAITGMSTFSDIICSELVVIPDSRESLIKDPSFIDASVRLKVAELDRSKNNTTEIDIDVTKSPDVISLHWYCINAHLII
tara:strand:+ start:846 stop:1142 length:297 start_codon:yes stop_codon:yes gene_type:complete